MFGDKEAIKARRQEEDQRRKTEEGVQLREKQGRDSRTGEQVWYSRRVEDGCQLHWAIITHGNKYELRLPGGIPSREKAPGSALEPPREYEARVVPWSLKAEMNRLRALGLAGPGEGRTRDYTVCQIGWTALARDQVDAEWVAARGPPAAGALGFDDCRGLVKRFARIVEGPGGRALDYDWFAESLEVPSHRLHEVAPDKAAKSFQHALQSGGWLLAGAGAGAGIVHAAYKAEGHMASAVARGANTGVPASSVEAVCAAFAGKTHNQ
ncbi:hypothetical protein LX36DRAFT_716177 [Colletotrichum falcatum]|nr:hypothetical protein LX36DRAFT_716177 [Colletotrichum falcatum]